jgi:hypothetical protein
VYHYYRLLAWGLEAGERQAKRSLLSRGAAGV